MGILYDDAVIISQSEKEEEPSIIFVNCPDKTGLGCDLCRIILFFGLTVVRIEWLSMVGGSSTGDLRISNLQTGGIIAHFERRLLGSLLDFSARELQNQVIITITSS
ncbi:hypothetical protein ACS0TY_005071 [Phlomoides rotata]